MSEEPVLQSTNRSQPCTSASSTDDEFFAIITTNLNNAKAVWGEDSERYRMMEGIASSLKAQTRSSGKSDSMPSGVDVAKRGGKSQGLALGELAFRPKAT